MRRYCLILVFISSVFCLSAQTAYPPSIVQEEATYYKQFKFNRSSQWDSLYKLRTGTPTQQTNSRKLNTTSTCNLNKRVFGFHPYWVGQAYQNYQWNLLSDFCYFDYTVSSSTGNNTNAQFGWDTSMAVTTAKANGVKIHFTASLFTGHATFLASNTAQNNFINKVITHLNNRGGDGINIDFESMVSSNATPFTNFMIKLCNQVHAANPNYEVSVCLPAVDWNNVFNITTLKQYVDDFIIMGYDYYYSGSSKAGPVAPLYNLQTTYNQTLGRSAVTYLNKGVPNSKLILALPYYGREWRTQTGTVPATVINNVSSRTYAYVKNNPTVYTPTNKKWEPLSFSNYHAYQTGGSWYQCWIDDTYSMDRKLDMINQLGIAGMGIWALGYDDGYNDYWQLIEDNFSSCAVIPCTDSIFDIGGPSRNYYDNEKYVYTIAPTNASKVTLNLSSITLEAGWDSLYIYDGSSVTSPLLAAYSGTFSSISHTSTGPTMTIKMKSGSMITSGGFKGVWNCVYDNVAPTTQVTVPNNWITNNFTANFSDNDNVGGSGIASRFYQVINYNGQDWRANGIRGFFKDDFTLSTLHIDWSNAGGAWTVSSGNLNQTNTTNTNTNLYTYVAQNQSDQYLYSFNLKISGSSANKQAGLYIMGDSPAQTNRGNSYLLLLKPDQSKLEIYESTANTLTLLKSVGLTIPVNSTNNYKLAYNRLTGVLDVWMNDIYAASCTDASPLTTGNYISFTSGSSQLTIDGIDVYRSRTNTSTVLVGPGSFTDIKYENSAPTSPSAKINSLVIDNAQNLSNTFTQTLNVDYTKPIKPTLINDGLSVDIDLSYDLSQLECNYTTAKDTNSGVASYYYAIGTAPGSQNILTWTSNGTNTSVTKLLSNLLPNQYYYTMVKAMNGAGLMGDSTVSDGLLLLTPIPTDIEEVAQKNIRVFPNPVSNNINLQFTSSDVSGFDYALYDAIGSVVQKGHSNLSKDKNSISILPSLSNGIYFLSLETDTNIKTTLKIIVDRN